MKIEGLENGEIVIVGNVRLDVEQKLEPAVDIEQKIENDKKLDEIVIPTEIPDHFANIDALAEFIDGGAPSATSAYMERMARASKKRRDRDRRRTSATASAPADNLHHEIPFSNSCDPQTQIAQLKLALN